MLKPLGMPHLPKLIFKKNSKKMELCQHTDCIKNFIRTVFLCLCIVLVCASSSLHLEGRGIPAETNQLQKDILQKARKFLLSKQLADGSWRSETYGLLKSGQSLTPFVLFALSKTLSGTEDKEFRWVQKSMNFLRLNNKEGVHGRSDPDFLDYPNYATSYALQCFLKFGVPQDNPTKQKMIQYLLKQQFSEKTGFSKSDSSYGGWGFGINTKPTLSSFVDLAHTRRVLEALQKANSLTQECRIRSRYFLARLQKIKIEENSSSLGKWSRSNGYDGGFFSSPTIPYANKGRTAVVSKSGKPFFRSYSTATSDGILALLALDTSTDNRFLKDASEWLKNNEDWESPTGIPLNDPAPWRESMTIYNIMVQSEAFSALNLEGKWRHHLIQALRDRQVKDGSFANMNGKLMKEDDPLISTSYALIALSQAFPKTQDQT